jgi:hypothetical protein
MVLILSQSELSGQHELPCATAILSDLSIDARPNTDLFLKGCIRQSVFVPFT